MKPLFTRTWKARRFIIWQLFDNPYQHSGRMFTPHGIVSIDRFSNIDESGNKIANAAKDIGTTIEFVYAGQVYQRHWQAWLNVRQCSREAWKLVQEVIAR